MVDIFFRRSKKLRVRVAAIIYNSSGEILLIQQKKKNKLYWLLPGGGIEFGETAINALERELKEELNLTLKSADFLFINESIDPEGNRHLIQLVFQTQVDDSPKIPEQDKTIQDFRFFRVDELEGLDLRPDSKDYFLNTNKNLNFLTSKWIAD
ncbi:MAG: NUDIX hydrolase [Leptospiraceae bacterium]|nr:NUDIX hydrolase [Leptospiraceae bacterium]MCP5496913.1 NUDIX hydrolase [Leptospiraceae bacterium]